MIKLPPKTFQKKGRWIEKLKTTEVLVCTCGNKYIKTRLNQIVCIKCLSGRV